jgi:hypothetical protein
MKADAWGETLEYAADPNLGFIHLKFVSQRIACRPFALTRERKLGSNSLRKLDFKRKASTQPGSSPGKGSLLIARQRASDCHE